MRKLVTAVLLILIIYSCNKKSDISEKNIDSAKIVDSINAARTKINDSILSTNRYMNWEGTRFITHDMISGKGELTFKKIARDEYEIEGELKKGKDYIKIDGIGKMVSEKHLNFDGNIEQSILENDNGRVDVREGKKTFLSKDGGKSFRLQQSLNSSGFSDQIYIKY